MNLPFSSIKRHLQQPADLWRSFRFYLHTHEHGHLLFGVGFVLVLSGVGFVISQSIIGQKESKELNCLTLNIYHEARGEPKAGKYAVGQVTLNRVASKRYPNTVCEVVYEKRWDWLRNRYVGAFSWTELERKLSLESKAWQKSGEIAEALYYGKENATVGQALFYHADHIRPSWARKKTKVARIGRHIFYN